MLSTTYEKTVDKHRSGPTEGSDDNMASHPDMEQSTTLLLAAAV